MEKEREFGVGNDFIPSFEAETQDEAFSGTEEITQESNFSEQSPLRRYLNEIDKTPLLSAEEERELAEKVINGDENAKTKLVEANLRLVLHKAKRLDGHGGSLGFWDSIQAGNLGLVEAAEKFDPGRGYKFSTYAGNYIEGYIMRAGKSQTRNIRLPENKTEELGKLERTEQKLQIELGREPSQAELAAEAGFSEKITKQLLELRNNTLSLDLPKAGRRGAEEDLTLGDTIADSHAHNEFGSGSLEELNQELAGLLESYIPDEQQRDILYRRHANSESRKQVAESYGVSTATIKTKEAMALQSIRGSKQRMGQLALLREEISR